MENNSNTKPLSACSKPLLDAVFGNSEEQILKIQSKSVDIICIDPPYLYLKNQKLDRPFDENLFFQQCYRILKQNGFIIMFGRGTSFYRWNTMLDKLGMEFKEEIIWDKRMTSSPLMAISRVHETVSIFAKGNGKINKVKIPYIEMKGHDIDSLVNDVKRLKSVFKNTNSLDAVLSYLEGKSLSYVKDTKVGFGIVKPDGFKTKSREADIVNSINIGLNEKSIINYETLRKHKNSTSVQPSNLVTQERKAATLKIINEGMCEKSIVSQSREHYVTIHPTQKPVRLLERLLLLCLPDKPREEIQIVDFFAGSFSCGEACYNLGINFKGFEIDEEYYNAGVERLRKIQFQTSLF